MEARLAQFSKVPFYVVLLCAFCAGGQEPITATWIGPASGGEWNTPAYWDTGAPPLDTTTNAFIGQGTNVNYDLPMLASSFGALTNYGTLNINTGGFNCTMIAMTLTGSGGEKLFINPGGTVTVSGDFRMVTNAMMTLQPGGTLNVGGSFIVSANPSSKYTGTTYATNNGGVLRASRTYVNNSSGTGNGLLVINGGLNDLGATEIGRSSAGSSAPALGTEGLNIYGGVVLMTNLDVGGPNGNSWLTMYLVNGTVTNSGQFVIRQITAGRASRFIQTGGLFVGTDTSGVNLRGHSANNSIVIYSVTGGTNVVEGFVFGYDGDTAGTARLTNAAKIYVGNAGFTQNPNATLTAITIALNSGGVFGAQADWTGTVPMILAGGAFDCANLDGTSHDITLSGVLSGSGALRKSGAGKLTLEAQNTYTGDTIIYEGTLALGPSASIAASPQIIIGSGATLDVSAVSGGFVHSAGRTLGGFGTVVGNVALASGAIINPGSNVVAGTLTIAGSLTETGGAINHFDLSTDPFGAANDLIVVSADLNLSDTNIIEVIGGGTGGSVHKLFRYGGSFNGTLDNFKVVGVEGTLSNNPVLKEIYLVIGKAIRSPTNVTWIGSMVANNWDTLVSSNWLNVGVRDVFVPGDNVRFDDIGAANPTVNVVGSVAPSWTTVDSTADYTFVGEGTISGFGGLTKLNIGTLTIRTTNLYTGPTLIMGGVADVNYLAPAGAASGLGAAGVDPANLVISNAVLRYSGPSTSTDRGLTVAGTAGELTISESDTTLRLDGQIVGAGGLIKSGAGTLRLPIANPYSGGTTIRAGTLQVDTAGAAGTNTIVLDGGRLHLALPTNGDLNNNILALSESTISMGSANNRIAGEVSGTAPINIEVNSPTVFTFNGSLLNYSGAFRMGSSTGTLRFNSGGSDPCIGSPTALFDLGTGTAILVNRNGSTYGTTNYYLGALAGGPDTRVRGAASTGAPNTYVIGEKNLDTTFEGVIENGTGGGGAVVSVVKAGTGTLTLKGANAYTGTTTVSNGVLALADSGSIDLSRAIRIVAPGILCVTGRYDGTLFVGTATYQTLTGDGTVRGKLDVSWAGTLSPGLTIGTLTVTEDATFASGGTAWMEINRATPQKSDKLVAKSITFGGTLVVTNIGTLLYPGDTFDLFDGALSGAFETIVLPNYYEWDTSRLAIDGTIRVVKSLLPPLRVSRDGSTLTLSATNGIPFGPLTLLTSTNVALPLTEWSVLETNMFDSEGNYSVTTSVDPAEPERFYLLLPY